MGWALPQGVHRGFRAAAALARLVPSAPMRYATWAKGNRAMKQQRDVIPEGAGSGSYLDVAHCPCCGAPAGNALPRVASLPPAESLSADRHGAFLSGYTHARVFFTYFVCANCSAMFCRTYYRQNQLDGLYGRQAENMAAVPLAARKGPQDDYT